MLSNSSVYATIGVKDAKKAKDFYENTLGLKPSGDGDVDPGGTFYTTGSTKLFVYESQFGGTNQATSASWVVDDIEAEVKELGGKGVKFEHYDFPDMKLEGDVHVMGDMKAAWFKDPDGNILALTSS